MPDYPPGWEWKAWTQEGQLIEDGRLIGATDWMDNDTDEVTRTWEFASFTAYDDQDPDQYAAEQEDDLDDHIQFVRDDQYDCTCRTLRIAVIGGGPGRGTVYKYGHSDADCPYEVEYAVGLLSPEVEELTEEMWQREQEGPHQP